MQWCRRDRKQGLEEYARNRYESHYRLLSKEQEKEILEQFKGKEGKQVTTKEIKEELDKACGKDTGNTYVYRVLKRHGWSKKMPRSRHPKAANEEACEASKKIKASVKEAQNLEPKRNVRLMFEDEAGFGRINKPKRC